MSIGAIRSILTARGRTITRRYVLVAVGANLLWEITQLPLYTIWQTGSPGEIAFAVVHCTVGDVLIGASSFVLALLVAGNASWPHNALGRIIVATVIFGTAYTVFSEWVNVSLRGSWAYAPWMPLVPLFGTGLTPLLQWVVLPPVAIALAARTGRPRKARAGA